MKNRANFKDTLIYTHNEKFVNKTMGLTDNESKPVVVEDEITRTNEWRQRLYEHYMQRVKLRAPAILIETSKNAYEHSLTTTYSQHLAACERYEKAEEEKYNKKRAAYLKKNPPEKEVVDLILSKFDKWYEKYKDDEQRICDIEHCFIEPWHWGKIVPWGGDDTEFYEQIINRKDWDAGRYDQVFAICVAKVEERMREMDWPTPVYE